MGPWNGRGALHFFEGWIIFVASAFILTLEVYLLARVSGRKFFEVFRVPSEPGSAAGRSRAR